VGETLGKEGGTKTIAISAKKAKGGKDKDNNVKFPKLMSMRIQIPKA